ncbi:hypothetical protein J6590_022798 [Homalodisca vitripennis]|nr:hypothetical protein J6590_022798 [Homalodisca vitripennis]
MIVNKSTKSVNKAILVFRKVQQRFNYHRCDWEHRVQSLSHGLGSSWSPVTGRAKTLGVGEARAAPRRRKSLKSSTMEKLWRAIQRLFRPNLNAGSTMG